MVLVCIIIIRTEQDCSVLFSYPHLLGFGRRIKHDIKHLTTFSFIFCKAECITGNFSLFLNWTHRDFIKLIEICSTCWTFHSLPISSWQNFVFLKHCLFNFIRIIGLQMFNALSLTFWFREFCTDVCLDVSICLFFKVWSVVWLRTLQWHRLLTKMASVQLDSCSFSVST